MDDETKRKHLDDIIRASNALANHYKDSGDLYRGRVCQDINMRARQLHPEVDDEW